LSSANISNRPCNANRAQQPHRRPFLPAISISP
jgi:hypothetical protein